MATTPVAPVYIEYSWVLFFGMGAFLFAMVGLGIAWLVRYSRPGGRKADTYECAEKPIGSAWIRFNLRYYYFALLFLLFDVEIAFFYPWASVFIGMKPRWSYTPLELTPEQAHNPIYLSMTHVLGRQVLGTPEDWNFGFAIFGEVIFFIVLLAIAWGYAWRKGYLKWD
jgi:NADH-quinone oxidoreductase subunit A